MPDNSLQTINIENKILVIRGQQVMLDRDLAELYGVETKVADGEMMQYRHIFVLFSYNDKIAIYITFTFTLHRIYKNHKTHANT